MFLHSEAGRGLARRMHEQCRAQLQQDKVAELICMRMPERKLMWQWHVPVLLGLLTGFFELRFTNIRMGLSAHLENLMNGTFLIALGAVWTEVTLPRSAKAFTFGFALYPKQQRSQQSPVLQCWGR
jgi:hypothetical protein